MTPFVHEAIKWALPEELKDQDFAPADIPIVERLMGGLQMSFNPGLKQGDVIDNHKLREIFQCSPQGGMRRSHRANPW